MKQAFTTQETKLYRAYCTCSGMGFGNGYDDHRGALVRKARGYARHKYGDDTWAEVCIISRLYGITSRTDTLNRFQFVTKEPTRVLSIDEFFAKLTHDL